ncbi:ABC transporter ATP-binding protein [Rhodococcus sp. SMB37]|uniref:ABC transporter ATP-binding protein n=1 Tax=unclassified Rhodococcus (in: high G+C Gram-positive bacteria) TaxID=192944 RepID=UPI0010457118|nr:ABC transporter ATP-binding protein [Rhodococcus sp. SMB37]TCN53611.1 peptide/nickel transport system ATP-binding protein/oligopeptide transport system ATP-binding protein [Rhodococcus sp. SMB37]
MADQTKDTGNTALLDAAEGAAGNIGLGDTVLEVRDLCVDFNTPHGWSRVVDNVNLTLNRGETLGLVGESGSGKTVTSLAVMGLLTGPRVKVTGSVKLAGQELVGLPAREMNRLRGKSIGMIFQEPRRCLNPAFTVGDQIAEVVRRHRTDSSRKEAWARAVEMLDLVGIRQPDKRADDYPHQFSGGMCQRVMLAMALACEPVVLIADEPTTALDVTVQAQVLALLTELQDRMGLGVLFITHDLGVVAETCDRVAVLYGGQVMEMTDAEGLFYDPQHPYTEGLLASTPDAQIRAERLHAIPGTVPAPWDWPSGCRFHPRCSYAQDGRCDQGQVALGGPGDHLVRCVRADELSLEGIVE